MADGYINVDPASRNSQTITRFKKWGDKMETISKCISNSILTLSSIKSLKDEL